MDQNMGASIVEKRRGRKEVWHKRYHSHQQFFQEEKRYMKNREEKTLQIVEVIDLVLAPPRAGRVGRPSLREDAAALKLDFRFFFLLRSPTIANEKLSFSVVARKRLILKAAGRNVDSGLPFKFFLFLCFVFFLMVK